MIQPTGSARASAAWRRLFLSTRRALKALLLKSFISVRSKPGPCLRRGGGRGNRRPLAAPHRGVAPTHSVSGTL